MKLRSLPLSLALVACGGSSSTNPGTGGDAGTLGDAAFTAVSGTSTATVMLSGNVTGSLSCDASAASGMDGSGNPTSAFDCNQPSGDPSVSVLVSFPGAFSVATFTSTTSINGEMSVSVGGTEKYAASTGSSSAQGSFSLTFESVDTTSGGDNTNLHGSFAATMPSLEGGDVEMLSANF